MFRTKEERAERKRRMLQFYTKEERFSYEYSQIKKLVNRANNKLRALSKRGTKASKELINHLSIDTLKAIERGRVVVKPYMTETQLLAIDKAVRTFLESPTSTIQGRKKVIQKFKANVVKAVSIDNIISDRDAEFLMNITEDSNYKFFTRNFGIDDSTMWKLVQSYKEDSREALARVKEKYVSDLTEMTGSNDKQVRDQAEALFDKISAFL